MNAFKVSSSGKDSTSKPLHISSCCSGMLARKTEAGIAKAVHLVVLAIFAGTLNSCMPVKRNTDVADAKFSPDTGTFTEGQRILVDATGNKFGVELAEQQNANTLVVSFPNGQIPEYKTERLNNPERVVIDLSGVTIPANRTFDTKDAGVVERVRLGAHPDSTRIVLDLPEDQTLAYDVQKSQSLETGAATLNFIVKTDKATVAQKLDAPSIEASNTDLPADVASKSQPIQDLPTTPLAKRVVFDDTKDTKPAEEAVLKNSKPVEEKEITKASNAEVALNSIMETEGSGTNDDSAAVEKSRPMLTKVEVEPISSTENQLHVVGSKLGNAALEKTAPSEYVLKIPQGQLAEAAATTILAPANAGAIRSVRPIAKGKDVWLRIFSQPNVKLSADSSPTSITVSAESNAPVLAKSTLDKSARAQASIEKITSSKSDKTETKMEPADSEVSALLGDQPKYTGRLISLDLQDTDIDNALRIIAEVSNLNIIASDDVQGKITLRLIDVPWDQALDVILKTNGLDKVQEGNVVRIAPVEKLRTEREGLKQARQAEEDLEPLQVRYVRISYAKAAELKALVESVLSERGSVAYDERTNQLIIKDIRKGIVNVAELIAKLDLRTPQVLLETQIVESSRTLLRELGSEFGFSVVKSPATGNATGYNFPNSISLGGSVDPTSGNTGSSFPAAIGTSGGSAVSLLLDSADATKSVSARLSALENEGRARIISRPAVATTNNKQAVIKSVEKIRIKTPQGGLSVATGQGAQASGSTSVATETVEIGIVLEVTPQASPDYYVLLDINAKSSTLGTTVVDGIPSEVERSATSSVLVSSGQTFAMGGIYKVRDNENNTGVPFLKDIPVLGALFRNSKIDNSDEELLFFITPRVIEGSFDDAAMKM